MPFWPFKKRKDPGEQSAHTLADLVRGITHGAMAIWDVAGQYYRRVLQEHFKDDGSPLTKNFDLPGNHEVDIPTFILQSMRSLRPSRMKVKTQVRIDKAEVKRVGDHEDPSHLTRTSFCISPASKGGGDSTSNHIEIEVEFISEEPPEGVMRLIEAYTNSMEVRKRTGPAALPPPASDPPKEPADG
jgi:hypothetical protein